MNAAHFARRFDRRLRRRPYRAVGDGVELPREELRRIRASDGGVCLASDGPGRLGQPHHVAMPALRLELTLGALPSDAWQPLRLVCGVLACWFDAGLCFFFSGWSWLAACNTLGILESPKAAS